MTTSTKLFVMALQYISDFLTTRFTYNHTTNKNLLAKHILNNNRKLIHPYVCKVCICLPDKHPQALFN